MKPDLPMVRAMPFYLTIQATLMLSALLEFPVYMLEYQDHNWMMITPMTVVWIFLTITGLVFGVSALIRRVWMQTLETTQRLNLAGGYLLGAMAGMVALGIRFPIIPPTYFYCVGALALILAIAYFLGKRRLARQEELFP
jgi:hypothetical protein